MIPSNIPITPLDAIYQALLSRLSSEGAIWADRVHADQLPPSGDDTLDQPEVIERPYVVYSWAGGGERQTRVQVEAEFVIDVICVANSMQESMAGAAQLHYLLNDQGQLDQLGQSGAVSGNAYWMIKTISAEDAIHLIEKVPSGTELLYYDGFRFRMTIGVRNA